MVALATLRPFRCDGLKSLKTRIENGIFFAAQIRACAAVFVDVDFATLRPFKRFSLFFSSIFDNFSSHFRGFGGSAPLVCAPAAVFVAIDFAALRRFAYFCKSRSTVTQLSGIVGPGPGWATGGKSIKNMQVFQLFFQK